jgi:iron(III) transport system ATP-binding protein
METNKSLKITDLNHCYKNGNSINNFNLEVGPGEVICILGPSGCGKTTLLRLIAGFEDPAGGQIEVGENIVFGKNYIPTEKRSIGMLFQDIALFPHLSVKDNIGFSLSNNKLNKKVINNLLKKVGLEGFSNRFGSTMSGGEQQRVALARALANNPSVMLLDEPFGSLDAWSKYDIAYDIINILKESKTPTIMVTHDPQEAMKLADKIVVMLKGKIIDQGSPIHLYQSPKHSFSTRLMGPVTCYIYRSINGLINTPFGSIKIDDNITNNVYEILIRPDAFTIPNNNNEGINIEILNFKYIGQLTEVEIKDNIKGNSVKFLLYSNIFKELRTKNKLLFNKDWAFVFPNK